MQTETLPSLIDRLRSLALRWTLETDATFARIGRAVVNDTAFFTRLDVAGASTTTATLEKFAAWLADPVNWPDRTVPQEALDFAHVCGVTPERGAASGGIDGESSPELGSAAA